MNHNSGIVNYTAATTQQLPHSSYHTAITTGAPQCHSNSSIIWVTPCICKSTNSSTSIATCHNCSSSSISNLNVQLVTDPKIVTSVWHTTTLHATQVSMQGSVHNPTFKDRKRLEHPLWAHTCHLTCSWEPYLCVACKPFDVFEVETNNDTLLWQSQASTVSDHAKFRSTGIFSQDLILAAQWALTSFHTEEVVVHSLLTLHWGKHLWYCS